MYREIIFQTEDDIEKFVQICNKDGYKESDINVNYGKKSVDGKSLLGVLALGTGKKMVAEVVPNETGISLAFFEEISEYFC